jgi:hypothetical protein
VGRSATKWHPVIVRGGVGGAAQVWRLADGTRLEPSLLLSRQVRGVAVHGNLIAIAAGVDIAVRQPALP